MKKLLLATSILAGTAGLAAAEVTLSGDARMGIIRDFGATDFVYTSRARVSFNLSGSSDSGLEFGASFRADNAGGAAAGTAGSVYVSGAFGKLSMGDVDHADLAAVGQVSGVGLTGLGDLNELAHDSEDADPQPHWLYEYSAGAATLYASADIDETFALGAKYSMDAYTVALGYSKDGVDDDTQLTLSASATFGALTAKVKYSNYDGVGTNTDGYAVSMDYAAGAFGATVFYRMQGNTGGDQKAYGLGGSYDLGGGAKVVGGYAKNDSTGNDAFDFGLSFSF